MPEKPRRPGTHRDYASTPSRGVPDFVKEEPTPVPHVVPMGRTPPEDLEDKVRALETAHNSLAEATWDARHVTERFDRLDRSVERIGTRLDGYAERVVRAEATGEEARLAQRAFEPKLDTLIRQGGAIERLAEACEKLVERLDAHSERLSSIEKAQAVAAERFEAHDERDQAIEKTVGRIETRVSALETAKQVGDATERTRKLVARSPKTRLYKAGAAVLLAIAGAITTYFASGGCT